MKTTKKFHKDYKLLLCLSLIESFLLTKESNAFIPIINEPNQQELKSTSIQIGKTAILIPTPGQTEKEYLASYFLKRKICQKFTKISIFGIFGVQKGGFWGQIRPGWPISAQKQCALTTPTPGGGGGPPQPPHKNAPNS